MSYWRLGTVDPTALDDAVRGATWYSTKERELKPLKHGDSLVLASIAKGGAGYRALATVAREAYSDGDGYRIGLTMDFIRDTLLPTAPVRDLLKKARLRINFPPLFVVQLSPAEYQVIARLTRV